MITENGRNTGAISDICLFFRFPGVQLLGDGASLLIFSRIAADDVPDLGMGLEHLGPEGQGRDPLGPVAQDDELLQAHTEIRDLVRRYAGKNQKGSTVAQQLDARKPKK